MVGKPKFKHGDVVEFIIAGNKKQGVIAIIDRFGIFMDDSEVYYDIFVEEENMLYKHIKEASDLVKIGEVDPNSIWDKL